MTAGRDPERPDVALRQELAAVRRELDEQRRTVAELRRDVAALRTELARHAPQSHHRRSEPAPLPGTERARTTAPATASSPPPVADGAGVYADRDSDGDAKVALYRSLFVGREDVYARRWENRSKGTTGWSPAHRGDWRTPRERREYLPLTDEVVRSHLAGQQTIGLYPLLRDDSCRVLVCDFDDATWQLDARAYVEAATAADVPAAVEVSRSGSGAHVWAFFTVPVPAADARALGAALLREAITLRGELDLASYDRFFPSQDHLPARGFGNLIALPLQGECRRERQTTTFVDPDTFQAWPDQFAFLSSIPRMTPAQLRETIMQLRPVTVGPDTRLRRASVRPDPPPPDVVEARLTGMLAIRRAGLPPGLYATLKHLATLHNPAFYKNENLRLSNHDTPRFIRCYVEDLEHLHLPRGLVDQAARIVADAGSRLAVADERSEPAPIEVAFHGELRAAQTRAVEVLSTHELGVLEAPPGAGKTVMACALIAHHRTPTLVLVDRRPLLAQWRDRLRAHLDIEPGQVGAGKKRPTKTIDIAMLQTVTRSEDARELLDGYGLVVVDECRQLRTAPDDPPHPAAGRPRHRRAVTRGTARRHQRPADRRRRPDRSDLRGRRRGRRSRATLSGPQRTHRPRRVARRRTARSRPRPGRAPRWAQDHGATGGPRAPRRARPAPAGRHRPLHRRGLRLPPARHAVPRLPHLRATASHPVRRSHPPRAPRQGHRRGPRLPRRRRPGPGRHASPAHARLQAARLHTRAAAPSAGRVRPAA